jgi:siroheme synthase
VAVVERAGTAAQRVVRGSLGELAALAVEAPATIVIGAVAALDLVDCDAGPRPGGFSRSPVADSATALREKSLPSTAAAVA